MPHARRHPSRRQDAAVLGFRVWAARLPEPCGTKLELATVGLGRECVRTVARIRKRALGNSKEVPS